MPRLSVVMIVKDESHCLGDCLGSVCDLADEIVVGDTGSTDESRDIARGFGATVMDVPWCDDFAAARNAVLAEATEDWLLHMDADEVLDPEGARTVRRLVDEDGAGFDAFEITLANYCDDTRAWRWVPSRPDDPLARGHAGYLPVPLLRLFRNRAGFAYREPVHENITASVVEAGGRIGQADSLIHHYGYAATSPAKAAHYLAIARKKMAAHPDDPKALHDFAEQANACGLPDEAEQACRRALQADPMHLGAGTTLANNLLNRGAFDEARVVLERLASDEHVAPHVLMALGALDRRQGDLQSAEAHLQQSLSRQPRSPLARAELARVHDLLGQVERAARELAIAHEIAPTVEEYASRIEAHRMRDEGEELCRAGLFAEALEMLVGALRLDAEDPLLHNAIGVVLYQMGQGEKARESFRRALQLAPGLAEAESNLGMLEGA